MFGDKVFSLILEEAIALDDKYWYALNNRGVLLWKIGEKEAAVKDYEKVRELLSD